MNSNAIRIGSTIPIEISVSGVLFDMDGVLVSSTQSDERCWTRWAAHHGLTGTFDLRRMHGRRAIDTLRDLLPGLASEAIADYLAQLDSFAEEERSSVVAYLGVIELLAGIPPYRWTVVSSLKEDDVEPASIGGYRAAKTLGRRRHDWQGKAPSRGLSPRCSDPRAKPSGLPRNRGRSGGIHAGKAAGCQVLAVASSHQPDELREADWIVASIDQVAVAIDAETATLNLSFPALQSW